MAAESKGDIDLCVAKPGLITASTFGLKTVMAFVMKMTISVPSVSVIECSAALLDQVVKGFEREPLKNEDLVRLGRQVLGAA